MIAWCCCHLCGGSVAAWRPRDDPRTAGVQDVKLLVLRHENAVLRRDVGFGSADEHRPAVVGCAVLAASASVLGAGVRGDSGNLAGMAS
jgi:hypothetical protein